MKKRQTEKAGKTVEQAINAAIEELGVQREDVEIEITDAGSKGIFGGIGSKQAKVLVTIRNSSEDRARDFLMQVFEKMNMNVKIEFTEQDEELKINLSGDDMGMLIGRRGETLDALQYLTRLVVNKGEDGYNRVSLDTENYRTKREETLVRLAKSLADRAIKTRKNIYLEPMNPYERKIIHASLQEIKGISTHSVGEDPNRRIVITYSNSL